MTLAIRRESLIPPRYVITFCVFSLFLVTSLLSVYSPRYVIPSCVLVALWIHTCSTLCPRCAIIWCSFPHVIYLYVCTHYFRFQDDIFLPESFLVTSSVSVYSPRYVIPLCGPSDEHAQQMTSRAVLRNWTLTTQYRTKLTAKLIRNRQLMRTVAVW